MNPQIDSSIISYIIKYKDLAGIQQAGINVDHFLDDGKNDFQIMWNFLLRMKREHNAIPSGSTMKTRFPNLVLSHVSQDEIGFLVTEIKQRKKFFDFLEITNTAIQGTDSWESVNEVIPELQAALSRLSYATDNGGHLIDLFSKETREIINADLDKRVNGEFRGIPTSLTTLDDITGGLAPQNMVTIMARTGMGKSWLNLLFIASAIIDGKKAILYPLEMQLTEVAYRLYVIFNYLHFRNQTHLTHRNLTAGAISKTRIKAFLDTLESEFEGQLIVADIGKLHESYTPEKIEAEVQIHKPDMFWVDYLTLMKPVSKVEGWEGVRQLSNAIKQIASRNNCVGGASAQVNRDALKANVFLPRPEHIAYGDAIGQDSDLILSIRSKQKAMYYALVKNRHGPEIPRTKVLFDVDQGILREVDENA